ncbi:MAG: hypothetical protein DDT31_01215 [Syntrophomonadaceae bacterium]|nr:hypothetical protein [Bacillota bacterium]
MKNLEKQGVYANVDQIKKTTSEESAHKTLLSNLGITGGDLGHNEDYSRVEVLTCFEDGHWIVIGSRSVVLKDTRLQDKPLPYDMPLIDLKFTPVPFEYFGMGIPEEIDDDLERVNTIVRQRLDNVTLSLNKPFLVNLLAGGDILDPDNIIFAPDNIIPTNDINAVRQLDVDNVTPNAYMEEEIGKHAAMDAAGEQAYARGVRPELRETATGIIRLQQAALLRFDTKIKLMEFTGIRKIGTYMILLIRRFLPKKEYERILGEKDAGLYLLKEEDLLKSYDIKPVGSSVTGIKEIRTAQILKAQEIVGALPAELTMKNIEPFLVNLYSLARTSLEALDIRNIEEILIPQRPAEVGEGVIAPEEVAAEELLRGVTPEQAELLMMGGGGGLGEVTPEMEGGW